MIGFRDYAYMDRYYKISDQGGEEDVYGEGAINFSRKLHEQNGVQRQSGIMEIIGSNNEPGIPGPESCEKRFIRAGNGNGEAINQGGEIYETEIEEKGSNTGRREEQQPRDLHFKGAKEEVAKVKVICAWCGKRLGEWSAEASRQSPPGTVSHGICEDCRGKLLSPEKNQGGAT